MKGRMGDDAGNDSGAGNSVLHPGVDEYVDGQACSTVLSSPTSGDPALSRNP